MGMAQLGTQRGTHGPGRDHAAIANAAGAVDNHDGKIFDQRRVLKSVVHHDGRSAGGARHLRPGDTVMRDDGRCKPRQQQRLVAHLGRTVARRVHAQGPGNLAAIAAAEKDHPPPGIDQHPRQGERGRCLAGAADGEIADADHRHAGRCAAACHAIGGDGAIGGGKGRQRQGFEACIAPPERGFTHRASFAQDAVA